ncbi:SDR family NAD(P)-dependent oxidoreductase [Micromonospora sp. WMMD730]|uniref:SDR family NAD(P)-dependent oxidoreductase n=1 Tax=Micromonospora sp. WMMD730 TaxID=3404128 RepID=UPI003B93F445
MSVAGQQLHIDDPASVARAMADVGYHHGRPEILVNNAGIAIDRGQTAASFEQVRTTLDTNLMATWRCYTAASPR